MMKKMRFLPTICVTHRCNLNCVYCYQTHDAESRMSFDVAKRCIDNIFETIPDYAKDGVELDLIGGEPLLEFDLIKSIYEYSHMRYPNIQQLFFATTNGTALTSDMKKWFAKHRDNFILGLSLDGTRKCHNANRSNSFDNIDTDFFVNNWPYQGVKMTLSQYSIPHLAENIKFIYSLGFKSIRGVNLAEGDFDWDDEKYVKMLIPQLVELVDYYLEHDDLIPDQMFDKQIEHCEAKLHQKKKWCGIGTGCPFFDVDGKRYPCSFITPMTFSQEDLLTILSTDFSKDDNFVDDDCFNNCYIYPMCPTCSGANYLKSKSFNKKDRSHCRIQKLIALFVADLQAKKIAKNPKRYDDITLYNKIEAIKKIRSIYLRDFERFGISS